MAVKILAFRARQAAEALFPRHPAQVIAWAFAAAVAAGTGLLTVPAAKHGPGGAGFPEALFTATSAVCVTGLITVDTPVYWTAADPPEPPVA